MSRKSFASSRRPAADWEARSGRGQPTLMRCVGIQTDSPNHTFGEYQDAYEVLGGGGGRGADDFYAEDAAEAAANDWQAAYSGSRGYQGLPVAEPVRFMNPYGRTVTLGSLHAPAAQMAPAVRDSGGVPASYRAGRNGSNWRHVTQCTGNLGNHIVYINGRVKADDCQRFPPHGFSTGSSLDIQAAPAAGVRALVTTSRRPKTGAQPETSKALLRARAGSKYWFEDKRPPTLTPSTIQGRIMKSGAAY